MLYSGKKGEPRVFWFFEVAENVWYGRLHVRDVRISIVSRAGASELDGQGAVVVPALGSNAVELGRHLSHVVVVGMKI